MARGKEITADKLEALGARRLAELLAELSTADPVVRKAAKLALAAGESPTKLLAEIDKRIRTIARSKTFIDWDRRKPLVQELENLRTTITSTLAPIDGRAAAERMVDFLNLSDTLYERVDDSSGTVAAGPSRMSGTYGPRCPGLTRTPWPASRSIFCAPTPMA
jgi:hypothetical protein